MSSILDALEKIEATQAPARPSGRARRRTVWLFVASIVLALLAGGLGATLLLRRHPDAPAAPLRESTPPVESAPVGPSPVVASPVVPSAVVPAPVAAAHAAAPVPAPVAGETERPWGTAVEPGSVPIAAVPPEPSAVPQPPPAEVAAVPSTTPPPPPTETAVAVTPPPVTPATLPPPPAAVAAVPSPATAPSAEVSTKIPAGLPRLRVSFLVYSAAPARRSVALTIENGSLTTLHEGEEVNGIEILRIRADGVELRWQGQAFLLPVRG